LYETDGTISKHDVDYSGRVEVIFRPKTDTSIISLHVGHLKINDDTMLKRRLSMDTPTEQVLNVSTPLFTNIINESDNSYFMVDCNDVLG